MSKPKKPKALPPEERQRIQADTVQMALRVQTELFRRAFTMSDAEVLDLHGRMARLSHGWQEKHPRNRAA